MNDSASSTRCPKCGSALPADAAEGLCPRCVSAGSRRASGPANDWEPPTSAELAKLLPDYEIEKLLGRGGMGAVYQGTQKSLDRPVAIKILSATLDESDQGFADRFKNEARALGKLTHPGIVSVYDFGTTTNGLHYIVMEFIDGTDVAKMIAKKGRLHTEHAMAITAHVCDALQYAHERGIIHRDIKPANIMVDCDGTVKVADFGLAKVSTDGQTLGLTQSGVAMGTLHYMAPEALVLGTSVDHRADIYAMGVMLYQMLTGKLPQGMFNMPSLQIKGLDPRYDRIIARALMEEREERYQSVNEMRLGLDDILTRPVVRADPSAEKAPAALNTQARPLRPANSDEPDNTEALDDTSLEYEEVPPPEKRTSPLLWATLIAILALGCWEFIRKRNAATTVSEEPAVPESVAEAPPPAEPEPPASPAPAAVAAASVTVTPTPPAPPTITVTPITSAPAAASARQSFGTSQYQFVPGALTWIEAQRKAEEMGGHLATITSKEENDWILKTFGFHTPKHKNHFWIGGRAETKGAGWRWITSEPFQFSAWNPGEPNDKAGGPFYLNIYRSRNGVIGWNDRHEKDGYEKGLVGFLVEWDGPTAPKIASTPATPPGKTEAMTPAPSAPAPPKPEASPTAEPAPPERWNMMSAITDPPAPAVKDPGWATDPLDRFVLAKLEAAGLQPNPDTSRHLLLRRVTFDLIGLPPTPQEIDAFVKDAAPLKVAYAKVVKRLLDSPRFGERWARHWLDVVRYADTSGGERPKALPMAWRYRDWVIDALNADKPYNRFVAEQIAGDLPARATPDMQIATGFLALGANDLSMIGRPEFVMDRVHEQIDTMTRAFLGLTVGCARCHDHRGDPIQQTDYYALAGIFLSTQTCYATGSQDDSMMSRSRLVRGKAPVQRDTVEGRPLASLTSALASSADKEVTISRRSDKVGMVVGNGDDVLSSAQRSADRIKIDLRTCMGATESEAVNCALRERGDLELVGPLVPRDSLKIPGLPPLSPIQENESGRLQLALWLISPENPLTPRVLVNRVWLHLFGRGIVNSPDDFGFMGDEPTHPELLDHLASRFTRNGWSVKELIRSIVMSRSYRMSSRGDAAKQAIDPTNQWVWRMNWKRLEAEALRDAWLHLGGQLNTERPTGPQVGLAGREATPLLGVSSPFRSIYLPVMRNGRTPEMLEVFDFPDPSQVTGKRESTTSGPQALFLMNSTFMEQVATELASPVFRAPSAKRPETAYMLALNRTPTSVEADAAQAWIKESTASPKDAWALFVQALLASPEFRYVR